MSWWSTLGTWSTWIRGSRARPARAGWSAPRTAPAAGASCPRTTLREPASQTPGSSTGNLGFYGSAFPWQLLLAGNPEGLGGMLGHLLRGRRQDTNLQACRVHRFSCSRDDPWSLLKNLNTLMNFERAHSARAGSAFSLALWSLLFFLLISRACKVRLKWNRTKVAPPPWHHPYLVDVPCIRRHLSGFLHFILQHSWCYLQIRADFS